MNTNKNMNTNKAKKYAQQKVTVQQQAYWY